MNIWPATVETIARAAQLLGSGELVAFPTETVYGLGANAFDAAAVAKIFTAKGRPATNPVIVHVTDAAQAKTLVSHWPEFASRLVETFWPGPLTLVLPKREIVPENVTAGGETVALRAPNHAVAQALLQACQLPLAAPSANRSTELSPTRASHVAKAFRDAIPILDGGPCAGGIESTVVDVTGSRVRILRPGLVTAAMIANVLGDVDESAVTDSHARSPGLMAKHYSPKARVVLVSSPPAEGEYLSLDADPAKYAAKLYDRLHDADIRGATVIYVEEPPATPDWTAVRDRLRRAACETVN